jgi:hypothetical protein
MFRAVAVPAGEHMVEFRYEPQPLQIGAAATLATGMLLLAVTLGALAADLGRRCRTPFGRGAKEPRHG